MNGDWLADLAPEYAPAAAGWWPPAPGWWALAVLALAGAGGLVYWLRRPRRRLRRAALAELRRTRAAGGDVVQSARDVQNLLRRYALAVFGAESVARLSGDDWLAFLAAQGATAFAGPAGRSLLAASYRGRLGEEELAHRDQWFDAAERFFKRARGGGRR
jgi:hypothetical protein